MRANNFFVCGPKFTKFLNPNVEGVAVDHLLFRFFILIYSGVICAKSRQLSEIASNFGRVFALPNIVGAPIPKVVPTLSRLPRFMSPGKVS